MKQTALQNIMSEARFELLVDSIYITNTKMYLQAILLSYRGHIDNGLFKISAKTQSGRDSVCHIDEN